jgi:nicotinate phosphoribosyltransferase
LITSKGDAALDGVYKLVAVQDKGEWIPAIKISETITKTPNPGHKVPWRVYDKRDKATADLLSLEDEDPRQMSAVVLRHPTDQGKYRTLGRGEISKIEPLLVEVVKDGKVVYDFPTIDHMREQRKADLERLDAGILRIVNPHIYHVSLTDGLWSLKQDMIRKVK